ncbi:ca(2+)/calmodulin-dependent protein kinase phosphatase, putative, partial [Ixodes scapularis]
VHGCSSSVQLRTYEKKCAYAKVELLYQCFREDCIGASCTTLTCRPENMAICCCNNPLVTLRLAPQGMKSGCTAVCCLVREQSHLYVGWLGDSQAMLARRGVALPLVNPHKPEREDERKRIEDLGGMVVMMGIWRVNGSLAVSRAIGDAEHKPYVISEPDVLSVELDGSEDFLVLGCDGLWDQLMPQDVANRVYQAVLDDPDGAPYVSHALVQGARDLGSGDNITAIVVFLRDPH